MALPYPSGTPHSATGTRLWIRNPLAAFTANALDASGGIVVSGGIITEVLGAGQQPSAPCEETFDAGSHVLLPGLINTHHHFYQTLTRAWGPVANAPLFPWLQNLYPVWARLTPRDLELATTVALAELMLSGCTTAADHHYLFPDGLEDAIDIEVQAVRRLGMRATLTRGSMTLGEDDGGLPPQSTVQAAEVILADSERLIGEYHQRGDGAMIQIALAPCSPFSVTKEIMAESAAMAERHDVRLHTHLAETLDEEDFCREVFGLRTVDYLESVGWLGTRTWLGHGIHFNDAEIARAGSRRHRRRTLPDLQHAPGLRQRPRPGTRRRGGAGGAGSGRIGVERCLKHDPRGAAGAVPAAAALRCAGAGGAGAGLGHTRLGGGPGQAGPRPAGTRDAGRRGPVQAR